MNSFDQCLCVHLEKHFVEENRSDDTPFGVLLGIITLLNLIIPITSVIVSALWTCDIERFKEPYQHPRSYLLAPTPALVEQGQIDYGATKRNHSQFYHHHCIKMWSKRVSIHRHHPSKNNKILFFFDSLL
ncbi:unnamed protein product [Adineta ricciae]|uniref:Uncharacterized protein n=1 Tax=Adineta ricciae TaxID=249248 RepID=A0A813S7W9_ADIRI|nr:unnamed protein product [Adineta ricciae]